MRKILVRLLFYIVENINPEQREFFLFKILRVKE